MRFAMPRLLRVAAFRFAALYFLAFAASALVLGGTVFLQARSDLEQQVQARVRTEVTFLQGEFQEGGLSRLIALVKQRSRGAGSLDYLVQDASGAHLAGALPATTPLTPGWTTIRALRPQGDHDHPVPIRVLVTDLGDGVALAVGNDLGQLSELQEAIATAFLSTVGLAALLGIIGGALISRTFLRRVDAIGRTAEAIIGGDLTRRVPVRGTNDDLDRLAQTLNRMLDRIANLMESLRQVSSDVAHDLRTPLSRLYQRLEDAQVHARSMQDYQAAVEAALNEAEGLLATFSALLRIAQVEGASPRAGFTDVNLSAVAETVTDAYRLDADAAGHVLDTDIGPDVTIRGNRELLTQALANLVENALRHTPPGTRIEVRLAKRSGFGAVLTVRDNGPGVAEADLSRLTDRFYRGEGSRTTPGNGLGLTLVSAVADLHGATLTLASRNPGLQVELKFPAADTHSAGRDRPDHATGTRSKVTHE